MFNHAWVLHGYGHVCLDEYLTHYYCMFTLLVQVMMRFMVY
jgi:hypothetical protein